MAEDEKDETAVDVAEEPEKAKKVTKAAAATDLEEGFHEPVTRPDALGMASPTNTEGEAKKVSTPSLVKDVAKALGLKRSEVLGFNEQTGVVVTADGGKYQLSKNGKALRHLAGPRPPDDVKYELVDARTRSVFSGTAAALNSSVHEGAGDPALLAQKAALEAQLAEVNEQLEG